MQSPLRWLGAAFLTLAACGQVPVNRTSNPTANFVQVSQGIYRGARPDQTAVTQISQLGVRNILNLEDDPEAVAAVAAVAAEKVWTDALGMTQYSRPMSGTANPDNAQISEVLSLLADPTQPAAACRSLHLSRRHRVNARHDLYLSGAGDAQRGSVGRNVLSAGQLYRSLTSQRGSNSTTRSPDEPCRMASKEALRPATSA